jgi:hypothetical protein
MKQQTDVIDLGFCLAHTQPTQIHLTFTTQIRTRDLPSKKRLALWTIPIVFNSLTS